MIVSEWVKVHPDSGVADWLAAADEDRLFISVITLAELRYGIERLRPGTRRKRLDTWLRNDLRLRFERRVLPIDDTVADVWGGVVARSEAIGRRMGVMDAFLAATAHPHGMTFVTRNTSDFEASVSSLLNPWTIDA